MWKRVQAYLDDPGPDSVHDLRTAARRLLACLDLLPKRIRKQKATRRYKTRLEKLIRVNARVRDIDIITSKVSGRDESPGYKQLFEQLRDLRIAQLKSALRMVSRMRRVSRPGIDEQHLSNEKLQRRFHKVNGRTESRIRERLPIVLGDPAKKQELHRLREDSRRLRYVLDLAGTPANAEPMPLLRSWQDLLGLIHDSDIMIDYLQSLKPSPEVQDLLRYEVVERNLNYEKFASMATTKLVLKASEQGPKSRVSS